jgi:hypothetical protein
MERLILERDNDLLDRQAQFAALLGVDAHELSHLQFCTHCGGFDYQWTDVTFSDFAEDGFLPDEGDDIDNFYYEYRAYLADSMCRPCDGTGFEGGSFDHTIDEWLTLGR